MLRAILRLLLALGGGAAAALLVAVLEARGVADAPAGALVLAEVGVLFPIALGVAAMVGIAALILDPGEPTSPARLAAALRAGSVLERLRAAALAPILVLVVFGWCLAAAHAARATLSAGTPLESGLATALAAVGAFAVVVAIGLSIVPLLRRLLATAGGAVKSLLDPVVTGGLALALVAVMIGIGVSTGDTGGGGGTLAIFGVLKRDELDLRPVAYALVIALGAYLAPIAATRRKNLLPAALTAAGMVLALAVLCVRAGHALDDAESVRRGLETEAPLGKISLGILRRLTDRDHDGYSARFGGGDCNDADDRINPNAVDLPGNGIDEDCTGADTPAPAAASVPRKAPSAGKRSYNIVMITIDTLRADNLGYAGYPKPVSPNLDALAAKATVFERGYSMASYTGKAVGPMLIGKYPSENKRSFSHFDTYFASNVLVAERLRDAGLRTFAGMCHWYFKNPTGLSQGFEVWDTSALPPGMGDNDTSVSSDRLTKVGLELLSKPENVTPEPSATSQRGGRFFAWLHYFDPHAQYVPHQGAPELGTGPRALYDNEVWFTDKHIGTILDHIAAQPWAADTAIIVTADHGEAFGEHGMAWHGREIWEELVRVPLIVYVPGAAPRRVAEKRSLIDIAPTIIELAGLPLPEDPDELRGKSLLEDVFAAPDEALDERDVYIDMPAGPFNDARRAIITGKSPGTKLIHLGARSYQLFDLAEDPAEKKDLSRSDKERLEAAVARLSLMRSGLKEIEVKGDKK